MEWIGMMARKLHDSSQGSIAGGLSQNDCGGRILLDAGYLGN
jgi:hypothetical protein